MSKSYRHAIERAYQHYGMTLIEKDIMAIVAQVSRGGGKLRADIPLNNEAEAHEVTVHGRRMLVIVNKKRGKFSIGTFYPEYRLGRSSLRDTARIIPRGE